MKFMLRTQVLGAIAALTVVTGTALADPPPPPARDPISLDRESPSVLDPLFPHSPGHIYGELGGPILFAEDVAGPGPVLHVLEGSYGLVPGDNNNGHSNGEILSTRYVIYFSGDDLSIGAPATDYRHQAVRLQAAGDRYVSNGATLLPPPAVLASGVPTVIAGPSFPGGANLLSANQHRYNEIPSIMPGAFNTYVSPFGGTVIDDMDALELTDFDVTGDLIHDTFIYFTLDALSPSLALLGPADILFSPAGFAGFGLFAPAPALGLVPGDVVDALALWDFGPVGALSPGDHAIFSLAPGSPSLAIGGYSPADVIATGFTGFNVLYLTAAELGMLPTDNIDALDVEPFQGLQSIQRHDQIPEPSSLALAAISCALVYGSVCGRRRA